MKPNRRRFLKYSAAWAGGVVTATTLGSLAGCARLRKPLAAERGYGGLRPVEDQKGEAVLALPRGFRYVTFSRIGEPMADGAATPINPDGMGTFAGANGAIRLIRNHEVGKGQAERAEPPFGPEWTRYDASGVGGTVTIDFDPRCLKDPQRYAPVRQAFASLNGTIVNCAGGYAYGDRAWLSCEETVFGPREGWLEKHGYVFLVPALANGTTAAKPIRAMGRFKHEAAVAELATGIVYETEDAGVGLGSGFYRYLPADPANLQAGGTLQMLRVVGQPHADLREGQRTGRSLEVDWVTIGDSDPNLERGALRVFDQGYAQGGAMFNRLEGIFRGEQDSIYFVSTSGGDAKNGKIDSDGYAEAYGQIWRYIPGARRPRLVLVFESPGQGALDSPDNIVVTPRGGIICCEDDTYHADSGAHPLAPGILNPNRLISLTPSGQPFELAVNRLNGSELAGACFSPRGDVLFVNIYGNGAPDSGMTCAITGPWTRGPL